ARVSPPLVAGTTHCTVTLTWVCPVPSSTKVTWPLVFTRLSSRLCQPMRLLGSNSVVSASHSTVRPRGPSMTQCVEPSGRFSTDLISFLLGGLAGAALALRVAQATGADARRLIGEGVREGAERGRDLARRGKDALESARQTLGGSRVHPAPGNGDENERVPEPG